MKAPGYIRVSSQEQVEGTSLDSQRAQIEAYASLKSIELVGVLQDSGVSGGVPIADRPEGSKLAAMIESGEVQAVIVVKLDRAFRNTVDCLQSVEKWEKAGVALHIIDLGGNAVDTKSPAGKFMLSVLAAAAEMERGMIRDRCNAGRAIKKAQNCRIAKNIPFGWQLQDPADPKNKQLVINFQEQEAIAHIHRLEAEGLTLRKIAERLNDQGIATKKGSLWTHKQVASVLKRAA